MDAQRYSLTLDLTSLDRVDIDDTTRQSLDAVVAQGVTEIPCTYWIDGDGRLLRVEQTLDTTAGTVGTVAAFTGFNEPLDIAVPDPSQVVVAP